MIELQNVSKSYPTNKGGRKVILNDCSIKLNAEKGIAFMGGNGIGKSTIMRMISGTELPDNGRFIRNAECSWPMGLTGTFHPSMSGRDNVKFVARIYGKDVKQVMKYVEDFAEIGHYMDMPVKSYSFGMRSRLAFGMSLAIQFEVYLIDEIIAVGDRDFRKKSTEHLQNRVEKAKVILISHQEQTIREFCDKVALLKDGKIKLYDNLDEGILAAKELE